METKSNENNIVITTGTGESDLIVTALFATFMMMAGAVAYMMIKQMETGIDQNANILYDNTPYNIPFKITNSEDDFIPPRTIAIPTSTAEHKFNITQETNRTDLSPVTYLGYNTTNDLVGVMKRMPNGDVMRRKIRDPNMSLDNLDVDRWVEYNDWKKESNMDWI